MSVPQNCDLGEMAEENRFVFAYKELPSLQEMASCQVALAVWNRYMSSCSANKWEFTAGYPRRFSEEFGLYSTYQEDTDALVESLRTPRSIERILKTSLYQVRKEMEKCSLYFFNEVLYNYYLDISTFKPRWCIWLPNGKIDYLKTAQVMVSAENNELNLETKFAIMCEFYLEEELKRFPLDSLPSDFIEKLLKINVYPTRCWIHYLKGNTCEEINAYNMVAYCRLGDGMVGIRINKFWHRLSEDNQVKALYEIFVEKGVGGKDWEAFELAFGTMSWDQQKRLLSMPEAGEKIIICSSTYSSSSKCAVWAWKHCRDSMSGVKFSTIVKEMFSRCSNVMYMIKLWDLAYDHHRNILVTTDWFFIKLCDGLVFYTSAVYILLNKSLAMMSMIERKALIMKFSNRLTKGTRDPCYIREMLDLNLPNLNDQNEYKISVLKSEEMKLLCVNLWISGNIDILSVNVEFYCNGDVNAIRKYNRELLSEVTSSKWGEYANKSLFTDVDKWHKCCKFIDKILPDEPTEALIAKQQLVSNFLKYVSAINCRLLTDFNLIIKTVESVFLNKGELNHIKTEFIKTHYRLIRSRTIWKWKDRCYDKYFHSMIEWCCDGNEEAVAQLKKEMGTHDYIFNIVFFQLNKVYLTEATSLKISLLPYLNKYLSWFLPSDDAIVAYKMHRLDKFNELAIVSAISKRRDEQSLRMLLDWFFDGDELKIREFRSKKMKS